jgi:hypothetical protein
MGVSHRRPNGRIDGASEAPERSLNETVGIRQRIKQYYQFNLRSTDICLADALISFTWAQFTLPLSTGGIALVLSATPHRFTGLATIGTIFFILALVIFVACVTAITLRFVLYPGTLKKSLTHPTEALFTPTILLSGMHLHLRAPARVALMK